jgi:aspartate/methionine/tyrosine aminotransferase
VPAPLFLKRLFVRLGLARWLPSVRRRLGDGLAYLRHFSDQLLTAPLADLDRAAACLAQPGPDVLDLSAGSPSFDLLPTGTHKLPADRRGWPPPAGLPELRAAVAARMLARSAVAFSPADEALITAGGLGAAHAVCDAFVSPGDRVVLLDPTAPLYPLLLRARRARLRWVQTWAEDGVTRFRLAHLVKALRGAKLLVLCAPNNPTGADLSDDDREQIAWWAERYDVLILSDESFGRFRYEGEAATLAALPRARPRLLVADSVSKGHALAAARVGWLLGDRRLIRACAAAQALRAPFVPTLSQQVALAALRADDAPFAAVLAGFRSRRDYAVERLRGLGLNVESPAGAFFLWAPVWPLGVGGRAFADGLLRERQVRVTPGDLFGPGGAGHVRLSLAADDGRLREGLARLADHVAALCGEAPPATQRAA